MGGWWMLCSRHVVGREDEEGGGAGRRGEFSVDTG